MENPAGIIIAKFGGHKALAEALNVDVSRVYRWTYDPTRGGTDGRIPGLHQEAILAEAAKRGLDIKPSDFFTAPSSSEAA